MEEDVDEAEDVDEEEAEDAEEVEEEAEDVDEDEDVRNGSQSPVWVDWCTAEPSGTWEISTDSPCASRSTRSLKLFCEETTVVKMVN